MVIDPRLLWTTAFLFSSRVVRLYTRDLSQRGNVHNLGLLLVPCYACSWWLQEQCAEDHVLDSTGKDSSCPLCLDVLGT